MVESTVNRVLNSKSASPPLRDADNVRSLIQLRGLRPPVLPPRLRRSGRNFDPRRGAHAPLSHRHCSRFHAAWKKSKQCRRHPHPKNGSAGMVGEALAWSQSYGRDRASARTRAQRRRGPAAAIDQTQSPLERIRAERFIIKKRPDSRRNVSAARAAAIGSGFANTSRYRLLSERD